MEHSFRRNSMDALNMTGGTGRESVTSGHSRSIMPKLSDASLAHAAKQYSSRVSMPAMPLPRRKPGSARATSASRRVSSMTAQLRSHPQSAASSVGEGGGGGGNGIAYAVPSAGGGGIAAVRAARGSSAQPSSDASRQPAHTPSAGPRLTAQQQQQQLMRAATQSSQQQQQYPPLSFPPGAVMAPYSTDAHGMPIFYMPQPIFWPGMPAGFPIAYGQPTGATGTHQYPVGGGG